MFKIKRNHKLHRFGPYTMLRGYYTYKPSKIRNVMMINKFNQQP